jgi:AcrR family transcriptional regulator
MGLETEDVVEGGGSRHDTIVAAATMVFLRYGYKRSSMDDLAKAAGLSRQGLYLHFENKDALFKAAILKVMADLRRGWQVAIKRNGANVEERILGVFESLHRLAIADPSLGAHFNELLDSARALIGPDVDETERDPTAAVAGLLSESGVAEVWASAGLSAEDLAENLRATSSGLKHSAGSLNAYRKGMRNAIKLVVMGQPKKRHP